jgi:hypothetical protein
MSDAQSPTGGEPPHTRFVVLRHEQHSGVHFDLMIDRGDSLATWQCPAPPETATNADMQCRRIGEHRRAYLEYEGPISGDRGSVTRHDQGFCRIVSWTGDACDLEFRGQRLNGRFRLQRETADTQSWRLSST